MTRPVSVADAATPAGEPAGDTGATAADHFGDRFRAVRLLKEGNGVRTFLGQELGTDLPVIIKVALTGTWPEPARMRLEHEAAALRALHNPYIGSLLAVGQERGAFYVVMSQVPGRTLEDRLKQGPLSVAETLTLGRCLLTALDEAHAHGVLHRDVKPANVIIDAGYPLQQATLIDFGLSRSSQLDPSIRDVPAGTARYIAPEQAGLLHAEVDDRADLYALGVVLFECLAGRPPFSGAKLGEILRQHLTCPAPSLSALGVSVPRALQEIIGRLLRKDPRDRYQTAGGVLADLNAVRWAVEAGDQDPALVLGLHDRRCMLTEPSFVGREAELGSLEMALAGARRGEGGLALVEAESGAGKSRMLAELADRSARGDVWILRGQGTDLAGPRPFQVLDGVVQGLAAAARAEPRLARNLRARLADQVGAVCDALPELSDMLGCEQREALGPEAFGELRSLRGLTTLLDTLGTPERPVLVLLDDCQWADELTLKLLLEWQGRMQESRPPLYILVVAAFRSEDVSRTHRLRTILSVRHVSLPPFGSQDVRALVESMAGKLPAQVVEFIQRVGGGSPFMAGAVLRGLVESGALRAEADGWVLQPHALQDVQSSRQAAALLRQRLRLLPTATQRLLSVAAVLGKEFALDLAARLAEQTLDEARECLDEARRRHIVWVSRESGQYAFTHDKLRDALLDSVDPADRRRLHHHAAQYLEEREPRPIFDLAYHFDAAHESARALPYALAAAEQARQRHALAIAEQQYRIAERGAAEDTPATRQLIAERMGESLMLRGQYAEAEGQFKKARALAQTRLEQARIARNFGELAMKSGELESAVEVLESGLKLLGCAIPRRRIWICALLIWEIMIQVLHTWLPRWFVGRRPREGAERELLIVALHNFLGYVYYFERGAAACMWTHLRAMNLAERYPPTPELALAYSSHAPAMAMVPFFGRGIRYARRSLAIRRDLGDVWGQGQSLHFYSSALYCASRFQESLDLCRQAIRILERTGDRWEMSIAGAHVAYNLYRLGELKAAVAETERFYQESMAIGDYQSAAISLAIRAKAACGHVPKELIHAALARCGKDAHTRAELLMAEGMRLLAHHCPAEAVRVLEDADQCVRNRGLREDFTAAVVPWLATALRHELEATPLTARKRRRSLLRRAWKTARRARRTARLFRNNLPHALRELGYLAVIRGHEHRARRRLDQSLAEAKRQGARYEQALTLEARGQIGLELEWPGAADDIDQAARLLRELRPPQESSDLPTRPVTLSLADRFDTILRAGRQIASALTPDAVYSAVHDAARQLLRGDDCVIVTLQGSADEADFVVVRGSAASVTRSLARRALASGRAESLDRTTSIDVSDSAVLAGFRSALYAPFFVRGKAAGCVCVTHQKVGGLFADDEHRLAEFITTVAGAALENAEGFTRLQQWNTELEARVAERTAAAEARARELQQALANVQALNGLLPICASCKMIRDDQGYWHQVELYIKEHSNADFSHGICPDCAARYFSRHRADVTVAVKN